jgi:hypothetical protein
LLEQQGKVKTAYARTEPVFNTAGAVVGIYTNHLRMNLYPASWVRVKHEKKYVQPR